MLLRPWLSGVRSRWNRSWRLVRKAGRDRRPRRGGDRPEWMAADTLEARTLLSGDISFLGTTAVSVADPALISATASTGASGGGLMSQDGRYVAIATDVRLDTNVDTNSSYDIYLHDTTTGSLVLVTASVSGPAAGNSNLQKVVVGPDDHVYVLFQSTAGNLVAGDTNGSCDVFVRDVTAGTTTLVSKNTAGNAALGTSFATDMTFGADGHLYVLMESSAGDLGSTDTNGGYDAYLRDVTAGTTTLVSVKADGSDAANGYNQPSQLVAGGDGHLYVMFRSSADAGELVSGVSDTNGGLDVFVRDMTAGTTWLASEAAAGASTGNAPSVTPAELLVTPTGLVYVLFDSDASDLVGAGLDQNGASDVYLREVTQGQTWLISQNTVTGEAAAGASLSSYNTALALAANGDLLALFSSQGDDVLPGIDANGTQDVFLRNVTQGTTTLVSESAVNAGASSTGSVAATGLAVGPNGHVYAFLDSSAASDMVANDTNNTQDVVVRDVTAGTTALVSANQSGTVGNGLSSGQQMVVGADGHVRTLFFSHSTDLVDRDLDGAADLFLRDVTAGTTQPMPVEPYGVTGSGHSSHGVKILNTGGHEHVLFSSYASNLVANDTNGTVDVFLRDMTTGTTILVSQNDGGAIGNSHSGATDLVAGSNGDLYVLFESSASNLVANDTNGWYQDVFLRDVTAGTTVLVSQTVGGTSGNGHSYAKDIIVGADGHLYVLFYSPANNLIENDTNGAYDVFLRDVTAGTTMLVSQTAGGMSGNNSSVATDLVAGSNGDLYVLFESSASNLVANDTNGWYQDVFLRDVTAGTTVLVSQTAGGTSGNNYSYATDLVAAANGDLYVLFDSSASNLVENDSNGYYRDIFLRDVTAGTTILVSQTTGGTIGNHHSSARDVVVGANGDLYVLFESYANNFVENDTNGSYDVYLRDVTEGTTVLVSQTAGGTSGNNYSSATDLVAGPNDDLYVLFYSSASNLVANDTNGSFEDVFLRDVTAGTTVLVSQTAGGTSGNNESNPIDLVAGTNGDLYVLFTSLASNLLEDDRNSNYDIFLAQFQTNFAPTDITLSNSVVDENQPAGTLVGTLTTDDPDAGDTFTYTFVGGDTGFFTIVGNQLQTTAALDYETQNAYSVTVRSTDANGAFFEKTFVVNVTDVFDDLFYTGTAADDTYQFDLQSNGDVAVTVNGTLLGTLHQPAGVSVNGGVGNDRVIVNGTAGADSIQSSAGQIAINGFAVQFQNTEINEAHGGGGNDLFTLASAGSVRLYGEAGADTFIVAAGAGAALVDAGADGDTLDFSAWSTAVTVNLTTGTATGITQVAGVETVIGGSGNDALTGDAFDNTLVGNGGNDTLIGNAGNDTLLGGLGNDSLNGGNGNDTLSGGAGTNTLAGGADNDLYVWANDAAADSVSDAVGLETFDFSARTAAGVTINLGNSTFSSAGMTLTFTGSQIDNVTGTNLADTIAGNTAANILSGLGGNDTLAGGSGNDTLIGGAGTNILSDSAGNDTYVWTDAAAVDTVTDSAGIDTVDFSAHTLAGISIDLTVSTFASTGLALTFTGGQIENVIGTDNDDTIVGNTLANVLTGRGGNDTITGATGNDTLNGGAGTNTLDGGAGNDIYLWGDAAASDTVVDSAGTDTFDFSGRTISGIVIDVGAGLFQADAGLALQFAGATIENVTGTNQDDAIFGSVLTNVLSGLGGDDTISGDDGNDTLSGGAGVNSLLGDDGNDTYLWGNDTAIDTIDDSSGTDTFSFVNRTSAGVTIDLSAWTFSSPNLQIVYTGSDIENVTGTNLNDALTGNDLANVLSGLNGNDVLTGLGGDDTFVGGTGLNTLLGGEGNDNYTWANLVATDTVSDFAGLDTFNFSGRTSTGVVIDLLASAFTSTGLTLTFDGSQIENVTGTNLNDTISGNDLANVLSGLNGDDTLNGRAGSDTLVGGTGVNTLVGGLGDDLYSWANVAATDTIIDAGGVDTFSFSTRTTAGITLDLSASTFASTGLALTFAGGDIENVVGTNLNDSITGNDGANLLSGLNGNDTLTGLGGNDTLFGGAGTNTLSGGDGDDVYQWGNAATIDSVADSSGNDTFDFSTRTSAGIVVDLAASTLSSSGLSILFAGVGIENVVGTSRNDTILGSSLANVLDGRGGNDRLWGADGNDTLLGGDGDDLVAGGAGDDQLAGGAGRDLLFGGTGSDQLSGGAGDDVLVGDGLVSINEASGVVNWAALASLQKEWVRSTVSFNLRADHLYSGGSGSLNGAVRINPGTVVPDSAIDLLFGDEDNDWFATFFGDAFGDLPERVG